MHNASVVGSLQGYTQWNVVPVPVPLPLPHNNCKLLCFYSVSYYSELGEHKQLTAQCTSTGSYNVSLISHMHTAITAKLHTL